MKIASIMILIGWLIIFMPMSLVASGVWHEAAFKTDSAAGMATDWRSTSKSYRDCILEAKKTLDFVKFSEKLDYRAK